MIQRIGALQGFISFDRRRLSRKIFFQPVSGAVALALSGLIGVWILAMRPVAVLTVAKETAVASAPAVVSNPYGALFARVVTVAKETAVTSAPAVVSNPYGALFAPVLTVAKETVVTSAPAVVSNPYGALFAPRLFPGSTPVSLAESSPLGSNLGSNLSVPSSALTPTPSSAALEPEYVLPMPIRAVPELSESAPLPPRRPGEFGLPTNRSLFQAPVRRLVPQNRTAALPATSSDHPTFFERLFGTPQPAGPALAYAAPESIALGNARNITPSLMLRYDQWTAVYDVAAHTVYLPNGTKLEAHSGLGDRIDDPRHVNERNRGATPPQVYELQPREQLFHGVQALRLKPVGSGNVFGRVGLLAHTYMLGRNGDSNGCVSFKNYNTFLQAFQNGEVKRLAVVTRLD
jgi:hypothetical protein